MLIKSLHLKNILSFRDTELELQPLNVLIGPNGSGKSNLIDVIGLLQSAPNDIAGFLRSNGPTGDWIWKGPGWEDTPFQIADVETRFGTPGPALNYRLRISVGSDRVHSLAENLNHVEPGLDKVALDRPVFQSSNGNAQLWPRLPGGPIPDRDDKCVQVEVHPGKSVLSEVRSDADYPELTQTAHNLSSIKSYRSWHVGRDSAVRRPQRTDGNPSFLEEDFSNLALVVNDLRERQGLGPTMDEYLERFYESYKSLHTPIYGNTVSLAVREAGTSGTLTANRLSDGTIRFIALLAILCHPEPPPLICIEEPEIAMHPDSQDLVVQLLRQASERTQLIVTTHSPWLIDLLSAEPDSVVVCERDRHPEKGTQFNRLSHKKLADWSENHTLGDTWMRGAVGGVRW